MSVLGKLTSIKILLLLLAFPAMALGKTVGIVQTIKGNAFVLEKGKAKQLQVGYILKSGSELITDEASEISFTDYFDHRFTLSGGSQIKIEDTHLSLTQGYIWIQSYNNKLGAEVRTANSITTYKWGEAVLSFDSVSGKSQLLTINGKFHFSNLLDKHLKLEIDAGKFSFVDNEYNKGIPRKATKVGYNSYRKVTSLFKEVKPMESHSRPYPEPKAPVKDMTIEQMMKREIASVAGDPKEGKILFIKKKMEAPKRVPASVIRKRKKKAMRKLYKTPSGVPVKVFGRRYLKGARRVPASVKKRHYRPAKVARKRGPASVPTNRPVAKSPYVEMPEMDVFENSLMDQYKSQMKHSKEVNSLIDELKNYQSDFEKSY